MLDGIGGLADGLGCQHSKNKSFRQEFSQIVIPSDISVKMDKDTQPLSQNIKEYSENVAQTDYTLWGLLFCDYDCHQDTERLRYLFC